MRFLRIILFGLLLAVAPAIGQAAEAAVKQAEAESPAAGAAEKHEEHGLAQYAVPLVRINTPVGPFLITNSMVVTWVVAVGLIVFAQLATRRMKEIPEGLQNFWEWMVESLHNFLEGIIGHHLVQRTFWYFATIAFHAALSAPVAPLVLLSLIK